MLTTASSRRVKKLQQGHSQGVFSNNSISAEGPEEPPESFPAAKPRSEATSACPTVVGAAHTALTDRNTEVVLNYASKLLISLTEHFISTNPADEDDYCQSKPRLERFSSREQMKAERRRSSRDALINSQTMSGHSLTHLIDPL